MKNLLVLFVILALILPGCARSPQPTPKCYSDSTGTSYCVATPTWDGKTPPTSVPPDQSNENAWYACTIFIRRQLGVSSNDAQRYTSSGVISIGSDYTVEIYYAKVQSKYQCVMSRQSNGDFLLTELNLLR